MTDIAGRYRLIEATTPNVLNAGLAEAVRDGLNAKPKTLPSRFFYDARGSELFEAICDLPEYYPTRAESEILTRHAREIIGDLPEDLTLVELGSGSAVKTRILISELLRRPGRLRFTPIDISVSALAGSSEGLLDDYDRLEITAVAADYHTGLSRLRQENIGPEGLILWLGSSIGNLGRDEAARFLAELGEQLTNEDHLLVGIDLRKDPEILEAAYDDAQGVTAAFNKNILRRINEELAGRFDPHAFRHRAHYDGEIGRVEMHLVSEADQTVSIGALQMEVVLEAGESIHTENSYRYSPDEIDALADAAGLVVDGQWFDERKRFSLNRLRKTA